MAINCEILDLRAFLAVAELQSFHRAAEALNLSQPALSRRIQKLEATIGAQILERTTRQVSITALGNELLPLVRRMLEQFDNSLFALHDGADVSRQVVTLSCLTTAAFYFLPQAIQKFNAAYPRIRFRILDHSATRGLQAVARGEVEFGINFLGVSDPELSFQPLVEDPFVLAALRDHPLMEKSEVEWEDLAPYKMITVHRLSGNRTLLDSVLAAANLRMSWAYEVAHHSTSLGLVEAGLGVSVLPRMATPVNDHPFLATRPVVRPNISRTIGIVRRRGSVLSPPAERFHTMLLSMWNAENSEAP